MRALDTDAAGPEHDRCRGRRTRWPGLGTAFVTPLAAAGRSPLMIDTEQTSTDQHRRLPSVTREPVTLVHWVRDSRPRCPLRVGSCATEERSLVDSRRERRPHSALSPRQGRQDRPVGRGASPTGISRASSPRRRRPRGWRLVAHIAKASRARVHARPRHFLWADLRAPSSFDTSLGTS